MAQQPSTLDEIRTRIERVSRQLDPDSRYISELLVLLDAAGDVAEFESFLEGSRGQRHAGADVFAQMDLSEKILANLITPETTLLRFTEGEMEAIDLELLPRLKGRSARALIVPCSHGEEAYTMAAFLLKVGIDFQIEAFDIQQALIEEARTGRLTFGYPPEYLAHPGRVATAVLDRIRFEVGDAFALPLKEEARFEVILCRNFVGYFKYEQARMLVRSLCSRLTSDGVLFLDSFCLAKMPRLVDKLEAAGVRRLDGRPVFMKRA